MADLRKVQAGQPFAASASDYNAFIDAANYVRQQTGKGGGKTTPQVKNTFTTVRVKNDSGGALDRFASVAITDVIQAPDGTETSNKTTEFLTNVTFKVDLPTAGDEGKWMVLLEPLADEAIGTAVAMGVTCAWIDLQSVDDTKVECEAASDVPVSGTDGFSILWVAGGVGSATATGEQYAVIVLGGSGGGSLGTGQHQGMVYQMVAGNVGGWDFMRATSLLE